MEKRQELLRDHHCCEVCLKEQTPKHEYNLVRNDNIEKA
jgi:hypothetical protein